MNVKLLLGIGLFLIGIVTALVGIAGVGMPDAEIAAQATDPGNAWWAALSRNVWVPVLAGLSLALGGLLIGLSWANWRHPRTHLEPGDEIVDPEGYHKMRHV